MGRHRPDFGSTRRSGRSLPAIASLARCDRDNRRGRSPAPAARGSTIARGCTLRLVHARRPGSRRRISVLQRALVVDHASRAAEPEAGPRAPAASGSRRACCDPPRRHRAPGCARVRWCESARPARGAEVVGPRPDNTRGRRSAPRSRGAASALPIVEHDHPRRHARARWRQRASAPRCGRSAPGDGALRMARDCPHRVANKVHCRIKGAGRYPRSAALTNSPSASSSPVLSGRLRQPSQRFGG